MAWLLVMAGGAGGSTLRYALSLLMNPSVAGGWPWGTLVANVVGCLLMGWLSSLLTSSATIPDAVRVGLLVGVLGGFTTFSSFGLVTFRFLQGGQLGLAAAYVAASNVAGIGGLWLGLRMSNQG